MNDDLTTLLVDGDTTRLLLVPTRGFVDKLGRLLDVNCLLGSIHFTIQGPPLPPFPIRL